MVKPGPTLRTLVLVVLLIVLAFLLLACGEEETPLAPTVTPTPTNYRTPIPTGITTATPTATKRPTLTPRPTSTAIPTATPYMIPTLGAIYEPEAYELATPSPEQLFEILMEANIVWEDINSSLQSPERWLLYDESLGISNETGSELGEYYRYELPYSQMFSDYYLGSFSVVLYPRDYPKLAHWAIGDYFLEHPELLAKNYAAGPNTGYEDNPWFRSDIYPLYLGDEADNEYLVVSRMDEDYLYFHLVRQDANGQLELVDSEPRIVDMQYKEYRDVYVRDLTGDGQTDLIIHLSNEYSEADYFHVYRGTSSGFIQMSEFVYDNAYPITWREEDTPVPVLQININHPVYNEVGICDWTETHEYTWEGGIERHSLAGEGRPNTIACKFAELEKKYWADDYYFDEIPNTIQIMEDIVWSTPTSLEEFEIQQFSRLKLAIYKAVQNKDNSARIYLRDLIKQYKESEFGNEESVQALSNGLQPLLERENIDALPLCLAIFELDMEDFPGWNENETDWDFHIHMDRICPIQHVVSEILADMPVAEGTPLLEKLNDVGLPAILAEPYQLPGYDRKSWFICLDIGWISNQIWGYVPVDDHFEWAYLGDFYRVENMVVYRGDGNRDGQEDLAFAGLLDEPGAECQGMNSMDIYIISSIDANNVWYGDTCSCVPDKEIYTFEDIFIDQNGDSIMDIDYHNLSWMDRWSILEAIRDDEVVLYAASEIDKLEDDPNSWFGKYLQLVDSFWDDTNYSARRDQLLKLLENPSEGRPFLYMSLQHIRYLIAMTYELEGNEELAIQYYLEVMNSQPQTLWANLAAAHLRLKE